MKSSELLFIYNADSGWGNALWDSLHKWIRPETYNCSLCRLTHGAFGSRKVWKDFIDELHLPVRFLHRDEWPQMGPEGLTAPRELPAIYRIDQGKAELLMGPELLNSFKDIGELIGALRAKIQG
ncbi:GTPase [Robiginitalea sp. IMCC43444]|uniref:GTPase n=1 Tax=Robiginitalea sp. IMCC43444 TaxID=3459121 RepID=UPI004042DDA7